MPGVSDILKEAESLPVEERVLLVDSILRTLNRPDSEIDRKWLDVAKRRLDELRSGAVQDVPVAEVFASVRERFAG